MVEQIADYDKEIERLFLSHEDAEVFRSLPGTGKRLAPRLLAEIGDDPKRYADAASLQALGGTSPILFQSGTYSKPHRRQGCIKPLRNALHQFARAGLVPNKNLGPAPTTSANVQKEKVTALLFMLSLMFGYESSSRCFNRIRSMTV